MSQNGITTLTREHFEMTQKLKVGYLSQNQKLEKEFHGEQQVIPDIKYVIAQYDLRMPRENPIHREKIKGCSKRHFRGRWDIVIKYPKSGKVYYARIRRNKELVAIEPIKPNRAFWLVDRKLIDSSQILDLRVVPHERRIHNKKGREFLSNFR